MGFLGKQLRRWLTRRPPPSEAAPQLCVEFIATEIGNQLLDALKVDGWKQVAQYSTLAFDKGIDYDFYRLRKDGHELKLEWDNWTEWTLSGSAEQLAEIAQRFSLRA